MFHNMLLGFLQVRRFCCRKGSYFSLEERQHRVFASQFDNCSSEGLQQRFFVGRHCKFQTRGKIMFSVFLNGHKMEQKVLFRYESIQICPSANSGSLILLSDLWTSERQLRLGAVVWFSGKTLGYGTGSSSRPANKIHVCMLQVGGFFCEDTSLSGSLQDLKLRRWV